MTSLRSGVKLGLMSNKFKKFNKLESLKKKEREKDSEHYKKEDENDWNLFVKIIFGIILVIYFARKFLID